MRIAAFLLLLLVAVVPAASHLIVSFYYLPALNAPHLRFQSLAPRILADLETVAAQPPFPPTAYRSDAEVLLAKYITWEGESDQRTDADRVRDLLTRYLYWKSAAGQLKLLMADPEFKALDTSWMNQLEKFDHWNLTSRPVIREHLISARERDGIGRLSLFATMPMPNFNDVRLWATLNVVKHYQAGDAGKAMPAFRKAAELTHSSGVLVGNVVAAAMLKDEHALVEVFKIKNWQVVPEKVIEAYQRVSWAWVGVKREAWFAEFPEKFRPFFRPQLGVCTAAWDYSADPGGYQDFLEPRALFESNFSSYFERARTLQQILLAMCNLRPLQEAFGPTPLNASAGSSVSPVVAVTGQPQKSDFNWSQVPYLRRILGLSLMAVAVPDYLGVYDKK